MVEDVLACDLSDVILRASEEIYQTITGAVLCVALESEAPHDVSFLA